MDKPNHAGAGSLPGLQPSQKVIASKPSPAGYVALPPSKSFLGFLDYLKERKITGKFLDVGCGIGRHLLAAAESGFEVYGIDFSKSEIEMAEDVVAKSAMANSIHLKCGNVLQLPYGDAEFEVVNDEGCLHHVSPLDWSLYLQNIYRVLKTGGLFHVKAYSLNSDFYKLEKDLSHADRWTKIRGKDWTYFFREGELEKLFEKQFKTLETLEITHSKDATKKFWVMTFQKI
jgi:ubiquinone/menaquinone biosynthesis C-methylase UbiE